MEIVLPDSVKDILSKFDDAGYEIYIVGSTVRDILMNRPTNDWDFTTNAVPEEILKVIPEGFYDNQFGTVGLAVDEFEKPLEITTYRTEQGYSDSRHPDKINWGKSLEEDVSRRDFTINALALDKNLKIVDLFKGVEQKSPGRHHIYDVGTHLLMSLKNCKSQDIVTRFATLIHDIGKPQTYRKLNTGVITFYNHEMVSTRIAENIADRLRFSKKEKDKFVTLVRWHQFTVDENQTDSAIRRILRNVGLDNMEDMLALRVADRLGGGARETSWRLEEFKTRLIEVQKQPFSIKDLKINGNDVMKELNIKPGPEIGKILEKLFEEVVEKKLENNKETLIQNLKTLTPKS